MTSAIQVLVADRSAQSDLDIDKWVAVAEQTLQAEGILSGELGLTFVATEEMTALNSEYMGQPGPTDVLAFPMDADGDLDVAGVSAANQPTDGSPMSADCSEMPIALGDVVICPEVARRQAPEHCGSLPAELALLTIHGVLHVLGHDHYEHDETIAMREREKLHMARHGFGHPEFA